MSSSASRSRLIRESRLYPVIGVVPYVILALLTGFTAIMRYGTGWSLVIDLVLCALAAAWMLWMFTLHRAWWDRPRLMAVFVAGVILLNAILVLRAPWFGVLAIAGFIYTFALIRWPWRLAGVAAVATIAGYAQASGVPRDTEFGVAVIIAVIVVNVVVMCGLCWILWSNDEQNEQRVQALSEVSEANRRLEAMLAENAALHEQLVAQARAAGMLDERQRMAREIHDTLAQGLIGIITQLQAAEQAGDDPVEWRRHFDAATGLARDSLSEARRSVQALRPEPLELGRLSDALAEVGKRWSSLNNVAVQITTTGEPRRVSPEAEFALLRAAQEALANVAKHANATRVGLTLSYLEQNVALDVRDDGSGFEVAAEDGTAATGGEAGGGFGLVAMRQRVESASGTLQIESERGLGTAISVSIPFEQAGVSA